MRKSLVLILILLTLSCNFPGFSEIIGTKKVAEPSPEVSPETEEPDPGVDEPKKDDGVEKPEDEVVASPTSSPTATSTESVPEEEDPTATHTPTLTLTPTATETSTATPTVRSTATKSATATSTPTNTPKVGPPMSFEDPAWELVEWHAIGGTGEWEGTLRARIIGGTPPYRSRFENNDIVNGLDMPVRWRLCKPMPATIRVISADGQDIHTAIWVWEVGCP